MATQPAADTSVKEKQDLQTYTCERCGFRYEKVFDYPPFLCYRCIRFIAKRVYTIMNTIQPTNSRPDVSDV